MVVAGFIVALVGLIFGLIGFAVPICAILGLPIAIVGLVLSIVGGKKAPGKMATAGLVIGIIATVFTAINFFTCGLCVICTAAAGAAVL